MGYYGFSPSRCASPYIHLVVLMYHNWTNRPLYILILYFRAGLAITSRLLVNIFSLLMTISLSNNSKSLFSKSINPDHTKFLIKEGFDHSKINEINKKIEL